MEIDHKSGVGYYRVGNTKGTVAYSIEIEDMVVADYDERGAVLGIEFIDAAKHLTDTAKYVTLATQKSKGPQKITEVVSVSRP